jgi:DNA-binding response OmpR family regulator
MDILAAVQPKHRSTVQAALLSHQDGYVLIVTSGRQLWETLAPFEVLIADVDLPGGDLPVFTICRMLRDRHSPVQVIFISDRDDLETRLQAAMVGCAAFVPSVRIPTDLSRVVRAFA